MSSTYGLAAGAVAAVALAAAARAGLEAALEPFGHRLDHWRRPRFEPERELGQFLESFLVFSYVVWFVPGLDFSRLVFLAVGFVWTLRLPRDLWTWIRLARDRQCTLALHERGFFLSQAGGLAHRLVMSASGLLACELIAWALKSG
jgi:hypothetical protein